MEYYYILSKNQKNQALKKNNVEKKQ